MKRFWKISAVALMMSLLGTMPAFAAYGPGIRTPGPSDSSSPNITGNFDVYMYPGLRGTGPDMYNMYSVYLDYLYDYYNDDDDDDDDDDDYYYYYYYGTAGWHYNPNGWWYQTADGYYLSGGWYLIDARWYYFNAEGFMKTGWLEENGRKYYLNPVDDGSLGAMCTGWQVIDNKLYYFNQSNEGSLGELMVNTTTPDGHHTGADGSVSLQ